MSLKSLFISYNQQDAEIVKRLYKHLEEHGITVWLDQESLYGGEAWPKALGEAIQEHDYFLLCWSANSRASHFVELEWNTAIAMKKFIIPYFVDDTPLPAVLRSINGVHTADEVLTALKVPVSHVRPEEQEEVVRKLETIEETDPLEVAKVIRATFFQPGMHVQGTVIQVAGDYIAEHAKPSETEKKKPLEKWHTWATLAVALLTMFTLILDLPEKFKGLFVSEEISAISQTFTGIVRDSLTGDVLPGVAIHILNVLNVDGDTMTDDTGRFVLQFETTKPYIELEGKLQGYQPLRQNVTLTPPSTYNTYPMTALSK